MQPQQNNFDFIMQNPQTPKGPSFLRNPKQRTVVMVLFVLVVVTVAIIVVSALLSGGSGDAQKLQVMNARQNEFLRMSEEVDNISDTATRERYKTLRLAVTSDASASGGYLGLNGATLTPEQQGLYTDFDFETELENAAKSNRYEDTLINYLDQAIADYIDSLVSLDGLTVNQQPIVDTAIQNIVVFQGPSEVDDETEAEPTPEQQTP